ncbi:MAG: glycosyltransferase family 39 protein [Betaproteobacteria bacterium]|nr:glycosyltransferase family 39 protein [Betaproteobacteria bacterium]
MGEGRQIQGADPEPAWLFGLFLLALLLRLACFTGIIASDDLGYSGYAQLLAEGRYVPEYHHFAIRYGLILPVGLIYALFGISEWSTIALPLFASSLSVVLLALIGARLFSLRVGLIAGLLYATFPGELRYATVLVPEAVAGCYVLLAVLVHVRTENRAPVALGALAGACLGIAYLTKEPALFIAPALFIDAVLRRRWQQAFGIVVGIGAIIACEHAYYLVTTGDLLFRLHALASHNKMNDTNAGRVAFDLAYRLFKSYPRMMLVPDKNFGLHSLATLVLSGVAFWCFRKDRRTYFLLIWASLPWIYLNFGSSSFAHYIVIPIAPRYIDFAYPPLFLLAAWLLADLVSKNIWTKRAVLSSLAAVLLVGVVCGLLTRGTGYRSDQVAVLRVIADKIEREALGCVRFDINPGQQSIWQKTLRILSGGKLRECDDGSGGVIIRQDHLGFPYVAPSQP